MFFMFLAFISFAFRGTAPAILTHYFANLFSLFVGYFAALSFMNHLNASSFRKKILLSVLILAAAMLTIDYFFINKDSTPFRSLYMNVPLGIMFGFGAFTLLKNARNRKNSSYLNSGIVLLALTALLFYRGISSLSGTHKTTVLFAKSGIQFTFFTIISLTVLYVGLSMIILAIEKLSQEVLDQTSIAEHSSRLASLGEMASGIAHEINNPLLVIQASLDQLARDLPLNSIDNNKDHKSIARMNRAVERITKIVNALLTFSRQSEKDPFEDESLSKIMEDTLDLCSDKFSSNQIEAKIMSIPDIKVRCKPTQISQILINLLSNAHDAIEKSTTDSLIKNQVPPKKQIFINFKIEKDFVSISVSNSGNQIPVSFRSKIFQPFFTTKEVGKGTGLGLSISKKIAEQHNGQLYLAENSQLTTFVLKLPIGPL